MANSGERLLQKMVGAVARVGPHPKGPGPVDASRLRRVLVVRTDDRVGNILLTTPLLRALREGLPHARIDWLLPERRRLLVEGLFLAHQLVPWNRKWPVQNPAALASLAWRLKATHYDAVLDAAHYESFSTTAAMITRWTGAPVRIGHARGDAAHYYTHPVERPDGLRYDVAVKLTLLQPLGVAERGIELETSAGTSDGAKAKAAEILAAQAPGAGPVMLVNPGARKADRRFAPERFGEIVRRVCEAGGAQALVVWGPGEEEIATAVTASAGAAARLAPPTDLHELAALLRRSDLLLTNDTGPMHLAVACGTPVVAVFTVADHQRWGHPIPSFRVVDASREGANVAADAEKAAAELLARRKATGEPG